MFKYMFKFIANGLATDISFRSCVSFHEKLRYKNTREYMNRHGSEKYPSLVLMFYFCLLIVHGVLST